MKKRILALLTVMMMLLLAACGGGDADSASGSDSGKDSGGEIKIGSVIDASGSASPLGKGEEETIKMIVDELNEKGGIGGKKIKLISIDSKSDQNEAVLATKKLIEQEKVTAIIGGTISGNSLAMIPLIEKAGIPYVSLAASKQVNNPDDKSPRKWTFKTAQGDDVVIPKLLEYLEKQGLKKVAWLNVANSYGTSGHEEFAKLAGDHGVKAVIEEEFEATVNDAKSTLTRVKKAKPEAIIVWGTAQESAVVTKNIREIGMDVPVIESHGIGTKQFVELAGKAANGVVFPAGKLLVLNELDNNDPQKEKLTAFKEAYESKYSNAASTFGGHAYDAIHILAEAIEKGGTDKEKIREALEQTDGFIGISGTFKMSPEDHNGLKSDSLVMVKIDEKGEWTLGE
ncbi:ABC transporter substrate-binding protein [Pseudobacillus wudalianchiensis]|uniref:ABC transporter substrate-binding protein n=1 Tax=Pseudobacillus wudalianchiensis TaxID=1743143 RepID=A0A1B9AGJ9_9BACI|nr:ABC transporter substrate-binding protein [Bacillus wudalianchiensis]OCA82959.1 ABC transporter substrate-binding protein [Bacillus wudalianchiensis]